jgi:hypothetical protein
LERAVEALRHARQNKRAAQRELNAAAKAAQGTSTTTSTSSPHDSMASPRVKVTMDGSGKGPGHDETDQLRSEYSDEDGGGYEVEDYEGTDESGGDGDDDDDDDGDDDGDEDGDDDGDDDDDEETEEEEDLDGFDMGNEALEQVRYRLETAKIDINSPLGTKLLDELLIRLQDAKVEEVDASLVNEFIDELLFRSNEGTEGGSGPSTNSSPPPPPPPDPEHPDHHVIRIYRGGKVLGWYRGQIDERGYARRGIGSMYYDAGHECHGMWENDEMVGRGTYKWSDGHVYDGDWSNGKRHGLGRFNRPDNVILYGRYVNGHHKGEGVRWSADRMEAQLVVDGVPMKSVSLTRAMEIATNLGFVDALPPPV